MIVSSTKRRTRETCLTLLVRATFWSSVRSPAPCSVYSGTATSNIFVFESHKNDYRITHIRAEHINNEPKICKGNLLESSATDTFSHGQFVVNSLMSISRKDWRTLDLLRWISFVDSLLKFIFIFEIPRKRYEIQWISIHCITTG